MFTKNDTLEKIMNTKPIKEAIGNLFPSCWLSQVPQPYFHHTLAEIEKEISMDWGCPFLSDAFLECANLLMETVKKQRFLFIPLWKEEANHVSTFLNAYSNPWIPDSDQNNQSSVFLFTGNPTIDNTAFANTAGAGSIPPYPSLAVSSEKRSLSKRPAVIICPGGAYEMISSYSEGVQLAQRMERDGGYKAFILNYRITPNYYPLPQMDLALAIMHVRANAEEYQINPNQIIILGASAGGHLCASEAYLYDSLKQKVLEEFASKKQHSSILEKYQTISARPDGVGLLYPVISFLSDYHEGSYLNLTNQKTGLQKALSVELHITSNYPPTYAFSNKDDGCVPVSNTIRLKEALDKTNVLHLCETYPTGDHGVGLGYGCSCKDWSEHMLAFFEKMLSS